MNCAAHSVVALRKYKSLAPRTLVVVDPVNPVKPVDPAPQPSGCTASIKDDGDFEMVIEVGAYKDKRPNDISLIALELDLSLSGKEGGPN